MDGTRPSDPFADNDDAPAPNANPNPLQRSSPTASPPPDVTHAEQDVHFFKLLRGAREVHRFKNKLKERMEQRARHIRALLPNEVEQARKCFERLVSITKTDTLADKLWFIRSLLHELSVEIPEESEIVSLIERHENARAQTFEYQLFLEILEYLKRKYNKSIRSDDFEWDVKNVFSALGGGDMDHGGCVEVSELKRLTNDILTSLDVDCFLSEVGLQEGDDISPEGMSALLGRREREIAEAFVALGGPPDLEGSIPIKNLKLKLQVFNVPEEGLRRFLDLMDIDHDGNLDFNEFTKMVEDNAISFTPRMKEEYKKVVKMRHRRSQPKKQASIFQTNLKDSTKIEEIEEQKPSELDNASSSSSEDVGDNSPVTPPKSFGARLANAIASTVVKQKVEDKEADRIVVNTQYGRKVIVNPEKLRHQLSQVLVKHHRFILDEMVRYRGTCTDTELQESLDENIEKIERALSDAEQEDGARGVPSISMQADEDEMKASEAIDSFPPYSAPPAPAEVSPPERSNAPARRQKSEPLSPRQTSVGPSRPLAPGGDVSTVRARVSELFDVVEEVTQQKQDLPSWMFLSPSESLPTTKEKRTLLLPTPARPRKPLRQNDERGNPEKADVNTHCHTTREPHPPKVKKPKQKQKPSSSDLNKLELPSVFLKRGNTTCSKERVHKLQLGDRDAVGDRCSDDSEFSFGERHCHVEEVQFIQSEQRRERKTRAALEFTADRTHTPRADVEPSPFAAMDRHPNTARASNKMKIRTITLGGHAAFGDNHLIDTPHSARALSIGTPPL